MAKAKGMRVTALTHDLEARKSFVTLVWESDATQSLVLPVSFRCGFEDLKAEAEKAVRELAQEITTIPIKLKK